MSSPVETPGTPREGRWRGVLFWILAFVIMAVAGIYQERTGPTYEMRGRDTLGGDEVRWELTRTHGGPGDQEVHFPVPADDFSGTIIWKRHKVDEPWQEIPMTLQEGELVGYLPHQPPAGKLNYRVRLARGKETVMLPADGFAVTRFRGDVPAPVLVSHIFFMFVGMLFSTRAGIEALAGGEKARWIAIRGFVLLCIGGIILGPVVQKYAFDALWTGVPFGWDLTDNKTFIFVLAWAWALWKGRGGRPARWAMVAASAITLVVYAIPHSVLGSELDYTQEGP